MVVEARQPFVGEAAQVRIGGVPGDSLEACNQTVLLANLRVEETALVEAAGSGGLPFGLARRGSAKAFSPARARNWWSNSCCSVSTRLA